MSDLMERDGIEVELIRSDPIRGIEVKAEVRIEPGRGRVAEFALLPIGVGRRTYEAEGAPDGRGRDDEGRGTQVGRHSAGRKQGIERRLLRR